MFKRASNALPLRPGSVLQTYPGLGIGNYLYFLLHAFAERRKGRPAWVLDSGLDPVWREALPGLMPLLASQRQAAWRRRSFIPSGFLQGFAVDFTHADLEAFVSDLVLSTLPLAPWPGPDVVVNVRRGDYYAHPDFRQLYGFDIPDYVARAVDEVTLHAPVGWLSVVSDDLSWCADNLAWLRDKANRVTFGSRTPGAVGDFSEVVTGKRLVLTNSTFSYWAGYTSRVLHGSEHGGVWVPQLHQRGIHDGLAWQHDPQWRALPIRDLS